MEKEPRHHLIQKCLRSTFPVEQLPIHFLRVSCTEKRNVEKSSITVSVSDAFLKTYQIHLDETKLMTLFHFFKMFLLNFGSWFNKLPTLKNAFNK